jgi:prevent-host-death family protein
LRSLNPGQRERNAAIASYPHSGYKYGHIRRLEMRHVPIAQFKDKMSEIMAAAEAGEDIIITRHGRNYMKLVPA